ncbi:MAG: TRAP transporter fused permease subunit [Pseudomonadota bacterium]
MGNRGGLLKEQALEKAAGDRFRTYEGGRGRLLTVIAAAMSLYHIAFITHLFEKVGIDLLLPPFLAGSLGFILVLVFLLVPANRKQARDALPWYDAAFACASAGICLYVLLMGQKMAEKAVLPALGSLDLILGSALILLVLEAIRRVMGMVLTLIVITFILETMFSNHMVIMFRGRGFSWNFIVKQLFLWDTGLFSMPMAVAATVIIAFLIFSSFLNASGAGQFFIDLALSLFGRFRGGPAKVAVIASAAFGTISGSTSANVATTGMITIPLMKRVGFRPAFAGAVEAVASNGGQLMPPVMGAVAFVIPEFLGIPYVSVCKAALFPALLYFLAVFLMLDLEVRKMGLKPLSGTEIPSFTKVMAVGWFHFIPVLALIFFLVALLFEAEYAALSSLAVLFIISFFRKEKISLTKTVGALESASRGMLEVGMGCTAAGIIIGCVGLSGLGQKLSMGLIQMSGGSLIILLVITAAACFVLGMGMTSLPIYIMLAVLVAPALEKVGVLPIAAHLFIFYWGLVSFITPPVCIAAFVAAAIAGSKPFETGWNATRLGITTFVLPFMFVYGPALLLVGSPLDVIQALFTSILGTAAFAAGLAGYAIVRVSLLERGLLITGALFLIFQGLISDMIGMVIVVLVIANQLRSSRSPALSLPCDHW